MKYYGLSGIFSKHGQAPSYQHLLREEAFLRFYAQQIQDQTFNLPPQQALGYKRSMMTHLDSNLQHIALEGFIPKA